jgi:hypothetical protein
MRESSVGTSVPLGWLSEGMGEPFYRGGQLWGGRGFEGGGRCGDILDDLFLRRDLVWRCLLWHLLRTFHCPCYVVPSFHPASRPLRDEDSVPRSPSSPSSERPQTLSTVSSQSARARENGTWGRHPVLSGPVWGGEGEVVRSLGWRGDGGGDYRVVFLHASISIATMPNLADVGVELWLDCLDLREELANLYNSIKE